MWYILTWLPRWLSCKESACQCRRHRRCDFDPWVGKIPWKRKWQPTPVFLPGKFHGQKSLTGYSSWGHKESDTTDHVHTHTHTHIQTMDYYAVLNISELSGHEKIWRKLKCTLLRSLPERIPWDMNQLHDLLKKAKLWRQSKDQRLPGLEAGRDEESERRNFEGSETTLCDTVLVHMCH